MAKPQNNAPPPATGAQNTPPSGDGKPARTRSGMSMDKRLAIAVASLLTIFARKEVKSTLKAEDAATLTSAQALAKEVNDKVFKKIDDRLTALQNIEIPKAATIENLKKEGGGEVLKKLTQEMSRLQNKRKAITEQAQAKAA